MLLVVEASTVGTFREIRSVPTVLDGDDLAVVWVSAHGARERQQLQRVFQRHPFKGHRLEERGGGRLLTNVFPFLERTDLHVRAEPARLRIDGHLMLGVLTKDTAFLGNGEVLHRLLEAEFVRRDVVGDRGGLVVVGVLAIALLNVRTVAPDASDNRLAVVGHSQGDRVHHPSIDVGEAGRHLLLETGLATFALAEVEATQPRLSFLGTVCDAIEVVFHTRREGVVDEVREVALHDVYDGEGRERRNQRRALFPDVPAILDGPDDRGIRRRTTDSELLEPLHQRSFGVASRRRRGVTLDFERAGGSGSITLGQRWQPTLICVFFGVAILDPALLVDLTETGVSDDSS